MPPVDSTTAAVALIVLALTNLLKTALERRIPQSSPYHDDLFRLLPLALGGLGNLADYLLTAPHPALADARTAFLQGLIGGGLAVAAYHTGKRQAPPAP